MKCCGGKKGWLALAAVVIGLLVLSQTSIGEVAWDKIKSKFNKAVPLETRLETAKKQVAKLDKEIDQGWGPIAQKEHDIEKMKEEVAARNDRVTKLGSELNQAALDLEAKVQLVSFSGKKYSPSEARRLLNKEADRYVSLKKEAEAKTKLLGAWEKELVTMRQYQGELEAMKGEMSAKIASLEADLKVLRLQQTKSRVPSGNKSNLDDVKKTLNYVEEQIGVMKRTQELRDAHYDRNRDAVPAGPTSETLNDKVVEKIRMVTGQDGKADVAGD
jgi:chromosome segregation ATPase